MPDIDSLSINITSSSKPAVKAINEIIDSLKGLNTALSNPQQLTGADKLAKELSGISKAVNSIDANRLKDLSNVLTSLSVAGTKLAKSGVTQGLTKIGNEAKKTGDSTKKLTDANGALGKAFVGILTPAKNARHHFTSLASVIGHLYANFFLLIRGARALGKAMDYSSSMTEAQNVVAVAFGKQSEIMNNFAETAIKDFGLAKLAATEYASRFQTMGKTMGITADKIVAANDFIKKKISGNSNAYSELGNSVADMSINLTKLTADMASLYNQDYADVAQDMQAIFTGMTRPLRKYGLDLTQATLKEWALANGLDANIEKMSQAEKTMLRYQYVMSRTSGAMGDFAKTADTWANAMRTVKQLLQEIARLIGEALINALRPALLAFRDFLFKFLKMTESALNALGKLLGWKQISFGAASIIDDTEDYADALDDATGAAKKLKGQLRGIDELNNLTTNKKGGSGSGGLGGIAADIETMLEEIADEDKPYESSIESFYEFGQKISYAIRDGLAKIDWEKIKEKAKGFFTNFASWLNGLIQPDTFHQIGTTVGDAIMTAIESVIAFEDEAEFDKWGQAIGNGINGFFEKFKGDKAAESVNKLAEGLKDLIHNAAETINWGEVFSDLKDFFTHIELDTIDFVFKAGALSTAAASITAILGAEIAMHPVQVGMVGLAITGGYLVGNSIDQILVSALGKNPVSGENRYDEMWNEVFGYYANILHLKEIMEDPDKITSDTGKLLYALGENRENIEKGMDRSQRIKIFRERAGFDKEDGKAWWQKSPAELLLENLYSEENLKKQVGKDKNNDSNSKALLNTIPRTSFDDVRDEFKQEYEDWWSEQFDSWGVDKVVEWTQKVKDKLVEGLSLDEIFLEDILSPFWPAIETKATEIGDWIDDKATEFYDKIDTFVTDNIVSPIEDGFDSITTYISEWWTNSLAPWFTKEKWRELLQPIRDQFKYAFQAGANFAVGAFNKVLEGIEKMLNGAGDLFNALIDLASKILQKDLEHWGRITLPRIATPYANGGYPQVGSLFLAGEAGSEMVGTINGRTGVVSNGEITGIADAIRSTSDTEIQLLRQQNTLLQGILNKEFGISSDSIFNSVRSSARDFTNRTGDPAFT